MQPEPLTSACLDDDAVVDIVARAVPAERMAAISAHLDGCDACRELVAVLVRSDDAAVASGPDEDEVRLPIELITPGERFGRYRILRRLGAGGMGVVYAARDPELDRDVALKLIRPGRVSPEQLQERLVRESRALARLSHPNVTAVHDVGSDHGQAFVAMQLVDGTTLRAWLRADRRPWREVVRVFEDAARGLAAAHAAGLVHRDFKPANVLIDGTGRALVTDFGLARALSGTPGRPRDADAPAGTLTETGVAAGTPAYMAPEQHAGGIIDGRTDQYSFCVALYEALCGRLPFAGDTVAELVDNARAGRVRAPQDSDAPGWLPAVVARGLSADPARRFPSMNALLDALAAPARRRRRRLLAIALVGAMGVGIAGGAAAFRHAAGPAARCDGGGELEAIWSPERAAAIERAFAALGRPYARRAWTDARRALDDYAGAWSAMHRDACLAHARGAQSAELLDRRMMCLTGHRRAMGAIVETLARADDAVAREAAAIVAGLPALAACADLEGLMERVPPPPEPARREQIAALREELARIRAWTAAADLARAGPAARAAVDAARATGYAPVVAEALLQRADVAIAMGEPAQAETALREATLVAEGARYDRVAADAWIDLTHVVGQAQGRHAQGLELAHHAAASLARLGDDAEREARARTHHGQILFATADYERAEAEFRAGLAALARIDADDSLSAVSALDGLALVARDRGDVAASRDFKEQTLRIRERELGVAHPDVAGSLVNLAADLVLQERNEEALPLVERALAIQRASLEADHPDVAAATILLGLVRQGLGDGEAALALLQEALALQTRRLGADHPDLATTMINLGFVLVSLGRYSEAIEIETRAVRAAEDHHGALHPTTGTFLYYLADAQRMAGAFRDTLASGARALAAYEHTFGPAHGEIALVLWTMGEAHLELGEPTAAARLLERAADLAEAGTWAESTRASIDWSLARALWRSGGDRRRAIDLARRARERYAGAEDAEGVAEVESWLAARASR